MDMCKDAEQFVHSEAPIIDDQVPGGHEVHNDPEIEYSPAEQLVQSLISLLPIEEVLPAEQFIQIDPAEEY